MNRVLITGGAGFIGSNLVNRLHADGYEVTVLDNLSEQVHSADPANSYLYRSIIGKARFIRGSVLLKRDLQRAIAHQDVIVHFAAETGTGQSMYQVDRYVRTNISSVALLLDLLGSKKHEVRRLVLASSRSIYGEGKYLRPNGEAIYPEHRDVADLERGVFEVQDPLREGSLTLVATDEESKLHPSSVYGITKQVQEQLVMTVSPLLGIAPVALRYQNVYGPGQSLVNPYTGILSIFANLIMGDRPINVFEDGLESRDFVFIDDVVSATKLAISHPEAAGGVFNVGSGTPTSVNTVVKTLLDAFAKATPARVSGDFRIGDIRHNFASLERISARLGFAPRVTFEEGIAQFVDWARDLGQSKSAYEQSLRELSERGLLRQNNGSA